MDDRIFMRPWSSEGIIGYIHIYDQKVIKIVSPVMSLDNDLAWWSLFTPVEPYMNVLVCIRCMTASWVHSGIIVTVDLKLIISRVMSLFPKIP